MDIKAYNRYNERIWKLAIVSTEQFLFYILPNQFLFVRFEARILYIYLYNIYLRYYPLDLLQ